MDEQTFLAAAQTSPLANCDIVITPACLKGTHYNTDGGIFSVLTASYSHVQYYDFQEC